MGDYIDSILRNKSLRAFAKLHVQQPEVTKQPTTFVSSKSYWNSQGSKVNIPYRTGNTHHVQFNSCSEKNKTQFCFLFANMPPRYNSCWEIREVALLQTSKFRYVSACHCSPVLNKEIGNISYITHTQLRVFFSWRWQEKSQAPGASAHKYIVLALSNIAVKSCSFNANLQREHLFSLKSTYTIVTLITIQREYQVNILLIHNFCKWNILYKQEMAMLHWKNRFKICFLKQLLWNQYGNMQAK